MIKLSLLKIKEAQTFKLDFFVSLISIFIKTVMGATILFFLQFLIGTYTPHVKDVLILRDVIITILFTFGGLVIPVEYLPFNLDIITKCTMIPYIYSFPANVISGNPLRAMDFAMQLAWVILLGVLTYRSYQKNVSHNVEYGD